MSTRKELIEAVKREISDYDDFLNRLRDLVDVAPIVNDLREDAKAKLTVIENIPNIYFEESSPRLLLLQEEDDQLRYRFLPAIPEADTSMLNATTSGSTSAFYDEAIRIVKYEVHDTQWFEPIKNQYDHLVGYKQTRALLPGLMGSVRQDLLEMFTSANESVEKSFSGILGVDQAAIRMRDVVEQLWGAMVEHVSRNNEDEVGRLKLRRESHRKFVAECLSITGTQKSLSALLDDLYALHQDLSPQSKDILADDLNLLKNLHNRWILQIDGIVKIVLSSIVA